MTMTPLFKKLNLGDVRYICVLNAPESFESELETLDGVTIARHVTGRLVFALTFVTTKVDVEAATNLFVGSAQADALVWLGMRPYVRLQLMKIG
jgi:hypothetical protein